MIILDNTTDKVRVKLGGAITTSELKCYASYRDTTSTSVQAMRNATNTNGTTEVDLVSSPTTSTQRIVDYLSVFNADTVAATVMIEFYGNSTVYNLCTVTLNTDERIEYQEGSGFKIITADGATKIAENVSGLTESSALKFVMISGDVTTTSTSLSDITDLSFSVVANKTYWFRFVIPYATSATSNGIKLTINGPASPTYLAYFVEVANGASTLGLRKALNAYDATPTSTNSASTTSNIGIIEGIIKPSANGTLIGRFGNEAAGQSNTIKAGAMIKYIEI